MEIIDRVDVREYRFRDVFMIGQDFFERIGREMVSCLQVQKFPEGKSAEVVRVHDAVQFRILVFQPHHRRAGEDDFQVGVTLVARAQVVAPVRELEYLVDEKHLSSALYEFAGKVHQTVLREIKVIHVHEQAGAVITELFLGVLQKERSFPYSSCAFDADEAVAPVDFVHQVTPHGGIGMFDQIIMCSVECFHEFRFLRCKYSNSSLICKLGLSKYSFFRVTLCGYINTETQRRKRIDNANQELKVVMFHRSYHFVQELKANSPASENHARGIGI